MAPTQTFLDPTTLSLVYQAFDDVWTELAPTIDPRFRQMARDYLAAVILDDAQQGERSPELLWCHAMSRGRALARFHRCSKPQTPKLSWRLRLRRRTR